MNRNKRKGTLYIILSAVSFAILPLVVKIAYNIGMSTIAILTGRFVTAAVFLWITIIIRKVKFKLSKKDFISLTLLGILGYGLMSTFYFTTVKMTSASMASMLLYTYPIIVTVCSTIIYHEKFTVTSFTSLILSSIGIIFVVNVAAKNVNPTGILYGLITAFIYSAYIIISSRLVGQIDSLVVTAFVATSAGVMFLLISLIQHSFTFNIGLKGWTCIGCIGIVSTFIAILAFFKGLKIIGPSKSSIISTLEPVLTIILSCIIFKDKMTVLQLIGGILILSSVVMLQYEKHAAADDKKDI